MPIDGTYSARGAFQKASANFSAPAAVRLDLCAGSRAFHNHLALEGVYRLAEMLRLLIFAFMASLGFLEGPAQEVFDIRRIAAHVRVAVCCPQASRPRPSADYGNQNRYRYYDNRRGNLRAANADNETSCSFYWLFAPPPEEGLN